MTTHIFNTVQHFKEVTADAHIKVAGKVVMMMEGRIVLHPDLQKNMYCSQEDRMYRTRVMMGRNVRNNNQWELRVDTNTTAKAALKVTDVVSKIVHRLQEAGDIEVQGYTDCGSEERGGYEALVRECNERCLATPEQFRAGHPSADDSE